MTTALKLGPSLRHRYRVTGKFIAGGKGLDYLLPTDRFFPRPARRAEFYPRFVVPCNDHQPRRILSLALASARGEKSQGRIALIEIRRDSFQFPADCG